MNIKQALIWSKKILREAEVLEPEASALVLLSDVVGMTRTELMAQPGKKLSLAQVNRFKRYINRRKRHESVWHILGRVQFRGLEFKVTKDVLVPRPETELLVEQVIQQLKPLTSNLKPISILDVGTGSGTIAISLASEIAKYQIPNSKYQIVATDVSTKALAVAKRNAKLNNVSDKINFIKADLFPPLTSNLMPKTYDLICANLPYIPTEDLGSLAMDVHHFEPRLALDGGKGGLEIYEKFLSQVGQHINPGGKIFCEIGINQGEPFKKLVKRYLPDAQTKILGDLAGIDRIAIISIDKIFGIY